MEREAERTVPQWGQVIIIYVSLVVCHNSFINSSAKIQNNKRKTKKEWFFNKRKSKMG